MPFFIAVTLMLIVSTVYLVRQFWSRSLDSQATPAEEEARPRATEELRAA